MIFERSAAPVLSARPGTFYGEGVTGMDLLDFGGETLGYVCGVAAGCETIGLVRWRSFPGSPAPQEVQASPVLCAGEPDAFDGEHVCDPACLVREGRVWMYYSGLGPGEDRIGLAISGDGSDFKRTGEAVLTGRAPEAVERDKKVYLFYVLQGSHGGYDIHLAVSEDGYRFERLAGPVIAPGDGWDRATVTTPRILQAGKWTYCFYCGGSRGRDDPDGVGVCRSEDLIHWEKAPGPLLGVGEEAAPDSHALWLPTAVLQSGDIHLFYEGGRLDKQGRCISSICHAQAPLERLEQLFG